MSQTKSLSGQDMLRNIAAWLRNEIDSCLENNLSIKHLENELNAVNRFLCNKK